MIRRSVPTEFAVAIDRHVSSVWTVYAFPVQVAFEGEEVEVLARC